MSDDTDTTSWSGFRTLWARQGGAPSSAGRSGNATVAVVLWIAALASIGIAWNGAASYATVPDQLPYFLSGGLVAIVLTLIGCAVYIGGAGSRRSDS